MELESLYQEIILDHYKHPRGKGLRDPFQAEVHITHPGLWKHYSRQRNRKVSIQEQLRKWAAF